MSLDISIIAVRPVEIFSANITHNLNKMAEAAGLYKPLWHPEQLEPPVKLAKDLIPYLEKGLEALTARPNEFRELNSSNGWGTYDQLVEFTSNYLNACRENSDGQIRVDR